MVLHNNQQNRLHTQYNNSNQSQSVEDDLRFHPFIETQKALAELINDEVVQQQQQQQQQTHQNKANQADLFLSQINQQNLQSSQGEFTDLFLNI
jgi:hypothetical protein